MKTYPNLKTHPNQAYRVKIEDLDTGAEATVVETGNTIGDVMDAVKGALLGVGFANKSIEDWIHDPDESDFEEMRDAMCDALNGRSAALKEKSDELQNLKGRLNDLTAQVNHQAWKAHNNLCRVNAACLKAELINKRDPGTKVELNVLRDESREGMDRVVELVRLVETIQELLQ